MQIALIALFVSLLVGQIGAITFFPGVTVYAHDIVVALIVGGIGLSSFLRRKFIQPQLVMSVVVFGFVSCLSLLLNSSQFTHAELLQSSLYLVRWLAYAGLYVALTQLTISPSMLFHGLFALGTGISLLGLIQYVLYPELRNLSYLGWDPHYYRLFSTLLDPNFTGIIIVLSCFLGLYLTKNLKNKIVIVAEVVNIIALYLTYSRSSYLALVAGALALIVWYRKWKALLFVCLFVLVVVVVPKPGGKTLLLTRMDSTVSRLENWQESWGIVQSSPVIGHGFNTLRFVHAKMFPPQPGDLVSKASAGVDSSVLFVLATTGIVGMMAYGWMVWSIAGLYHNSRLIALRGVALSVFTALVVHSFFINSLFYPWVMIWIWIFIAASEGMMRSVKK